MTKYQRRIFLDRVRLPGLKAASISVTRPRAYTELSEAIEAWGFRLMQQEARYMDRATVAWRWYTEEFTPVVRMLGEAGLVAPPPPTPTCSCRCIATGCQTRSAGPMTWSSIFGVVDCVRAACVATSGENRAFRRTRVM